MAASNLKIANVWRVPARLWSESFAKHPLAISLFLAFLIRTVAAIRNYGPFAVDDYQNVIEPALRYLILHTQPEIPTLRFEILPYTFALFMKPLYLLGIKRADYLVSFAYFIMGVISLSQIYAIHKIGGLLLKPKWQNAMTLFTATWAIAPIFTNSADIAGPAHILLTYAILHLIRALPDAFGASLARITASPARSLIYCGFYLSAAVFFRFSLAPLYFALAVWLLVRLPHSQKTKPILAFFLGGLITAAVMVALEIYSHKLPFSTALEFIRYNFGAHIETHSYGNMPWYMYILIFAIFPLPVLSFFFWKPMFSAARKLPALHVLLLTFLVSHSAIAFKLERYVIPLLPVVTIFLFKGIEDYQHKAWVRIPYRVLMILNLLFIFPVMLTMQQRAGVDGAIYFGQVRGHKIAHRIDPWRQAYYGFRRDQPTFTQNSPDILALVQRENWLTFYIFRFMYFSKVELLTFSNAGIACHQERIFEPDYLELISIRLNPAMNFRRNDTVVYFCTKATPSLPQ